MTTENFTAFKAFSWLPNDVHTRQTDFMEAAHDIAKGIALALDIVNTSQIQRENGHGPGGGDPPVLGLNDTASMLLFAKQSARILAQYAEQQMEEHTRLRGKK